jgi:hypothetical protein
LTNTFVNVLALDFQDPQTLYAGTSSGIFSITFPSFTAILEDHTTTLPQSFTLLQNYPNPFNSTTVIRFALPTRADVHLALYNLAGQKVVTLVDGMRSARSYTVHWDGRDASGRDLASGVYLYRLRAGEQQVETRRLLLLR